MTVAAVLVACVAAAAPLKTQIWSDSSLPVAAKLLPGGAGGGKASVRISNPGPGQLRVTLALFRRPGINKPFWSVRGRVRTERVVGQAFLEMWSTFPDGSSFFSRTLAADGPMRHLGGTQDWHAFVLPFQSDPGRPGPAELTVNLILPGPGIVEIGPLDVFEHQSAASMLAPEVRRPGGR